MYNIKINRRKIITGIKSINIFNNVNLKYFIIKLKSKYLILLILILFWLIYELYKFISKILLYKNITIYTNIVKKNIIFQKTVSKKTWLSNQFISKLGSFHVDIANI